MSYERHRGKLRFLGDDYTYWTWAEGKESSYFNFMHKLSRETGFGLKVLINAIPISMWKIHAVPAKRTMDQQVELNNIDIGKSEKTVMECRNVASSWFSATKVTGKIPVPETKVIDDKGHVFEVKFIGRVLFQSELESGVSDNEKDNRVDDRCTRLQSCLDEIVKVAQRARR
jgi:hypothetical protein